MLYESTRNSNVSILSSEVIMQGIAPDGGLFLPKELSMVSLETVKKMVDMDYCKRAESILNLFLTDFSTEEVQICVRNAYSNKKFDTYDIAPIYKLNNRQYILELWHGPTCAFKDMALQILPQLMTFAREKVGQKDQILILVATSGDTGKAALEGFKDVPGIRLVVFYPDEGVSDAQRMQMITQDGANLDVISVAGNFDDAQMGVKNLFVDEAFLQQVKNLGYRLSSANSINWGRLVPQLVYYFSSYCDMIRAGAIVAGEKINFVIPTGNFGNILAGYYARKMGLPINRLICASNMNNVLTDFFYTGVYNKNKEFKKTISPSMDILISSNLERFLYEMTEHNSQKVSQWMKNLKQDGIYEIDSETHSVMTDIIWAGYANDEQTSETIDSVFRDYHYLLDPHTAVGEKVYLDYVKQTQDVSKTVIIATASPFKFASDVLLSLYVPEISLSRDIFDLQMQLEKISGEHTPESLRILKGKQVVHTKKCSKHAMMAAVSAIIKKADS